MPRVTLYWRPMCGYCEKLKRSLARHGIPYTAVDIWSDREMAAIVRRATGGDEIVPTVQVDERFLIHPSAEEVIRALAA